MTESPAIHFAFRFHGNFYHSYRGDTPNELGFGKDIRIIRHILRVLDGANENGIPVKGTWDFENYFSFEKIIPEHAPDIITDMQRRVRMHGDEIEYMSWNNGFVNAHTAREFEVAMRMAISNPQGSGLKDLFGEQVAPIVRPQEMMFTPIHLKLYRALGIETVSLYYSAIPFNGFSNFIPLLSPAERYNPLTLTYPGIDETMTLLPCYNIGDLAEYITLRRWLLHMRREQLAMPNPIDFLLILDQDADDAFWYGFDAPSVLKKSLSTINGLQGLIDNVADLDFLRFNTPGEYLKDHQPLKSVTFGQDTADGSFDGLASWVEKWSNHRLYTALEQARILHLQTMHLQPDLPPETAKLLEDALLTRVKLLSTTHFGMAAPVMNLERERAAVALAEEALDAASKAFEASQRLPTQGQFQLIDYVRGERSDEMSFSPKASRTLQRIVLTSGDEAALSTENGAPVPTLTICDEGKSEVIFRADFDPLEEITYVVDPTPDQSDERHSEDISGRDLENEWLQVLFNQRGQVASLVAEGRLVGELGFLTSGVFYGKDRLTVPTWETEAVHRANGISHLRQTGSLRLPNGPEVTYERSWLMAEDLPWIYLDTHVRYPRTPDHGFEKSRAKRLQQGWDERWQEVFPSQFAPLLSQKDGGKLRVWKHNYAGHVSSFDLDYSGFSKNDALASINNQITFGWVAVSDSRQGLLLAQSADAAVNVAFCPMRTLRRKDDYHVLLNPFGCYTGPQYRMPIKGSGLGYTLSTRLSAAGHLKTLAPSYNGRELTYRLMIAPYLGDEPPADLQASALAFSYPPITLGDPALINAPGHRQWDPAGLGVNPDGDRAPSV